MTKFVLCLFIIVALFLWKTTVFLDPDFGWHVRTGQLILSSSVPQTDPFSYTMSTYSYVDHSWLTDVIIAKLLPTVGIFGLAGLFTSFCLGAFLMVSKWKKPSPFLISLLLPGLTVLFSYAAIRPVLVSWLFFAILIWFLSRPFNNRQFWLFPPFFLLWANLHGGFALGLVVFFVYVLFRKELLIIFLISLVVTLINPYGLGLWREVFLTVSDRSLFLAIDEWNPTIFSFDPSFAFTLGLSGLIILGYPRRFSWPTKLVYLLLASMALFSKRHLPFFIITSVPILVAGHDLFLQSLPKNNLVKKRWQWGQWTLLVISLVIATLSVWFAVRDKMILTEQNFYPQGAVSYLRNHQTGGEIFSTYNWGGYLIWKLPEKKVFIDGRMPSWRGKDEFGQDFSIFDRYEQIVTGKEDLHPVFAKYNIKYVLLSASKKAPPPGSFLDQLYKNGWRIVYEDDMAIVLSFP